MKNWVSLTLLTLFTALGISHLQAGEFLLASTDAELERTAMENFGILVAKLSPLLIIIGVGGTFVELKMPGFGIGGAVAVVAFGLFFYTNFLAGNLANYELAGLLVIGIVLVAVELFVLPGMGFAGLTGAGCILAALLLGMVDRADWDLWRAGDYSGTLFELIRTPVLYLTIGLFGAGVLLVMLMRYLPAIPFFNCLMVEKELAGGASLLKDGEQENRLGWTGVSLTDLRPAGKVRFDEGDLDVVADAGAFIPKGTKVRISEADGVRVVVTPLIGV